MNSATRETFTLQYKVCQSKKERKKRAFTSINEKKKTKHKRVVLEIKLMISPLLQSINSGEPERVIKN